MRFPGLFNAAYDYYYIQNDQEKECSYPLAQYIFSCWICECCGCCDLKCDFCPHEKAVCDDVYVHCDYCCGCTCKCQDDENCCKEVCCCRISNDVENHCRCLRCNEFCPGCTEYEYCREIIGGIFFFMCYIAYLLISYLLFPLILLCASCASCGTANEKERYFEDNMDKFLEESEKRKAEYATMTPNDAAKAKKERRRQCVQKRYREEQEKYEQFLGQRQLQTNQSQDFNSNQEQPGQLYEPLQLNNQQLPDLPAPNVFYQSPPQQGVSPDSPYYNHYSQQSGQQFPQQEQSPDNN